MTKSQSPETTESVDPVCRIRIDLLNRLAGAVEMLGRAKLDLKTSMENGTWSPGLFTKGEVEQLRNECGSIRAELQLHRLSHGC